MAQNPITTIALKRKTAEVLRKAELAKGEYFDSIINRLLTEHNSKSSEAHENCDTKSVGNKQ